MGFGYAMINDSAEIIKDSEKPQIEMKKGESVDGSRFIDAKVCNIFWERINLFFEVEVLFEGDFDPEKLQFFAVDRFGNVGARVSVVSRSDGCFKLHVNITNAGASSPIPAGNYSLYVCSGEEFFGCCKVTPEAKAGLMNASRSFLYRNRMYSFIVQFLVNNNSDVLTMFVMSGSAIVAGYSSEQSDDSLENLLM